MLKSSVKIYIHRFGVKIYFRLGGKTKINIEMCMYKRKIQIHIHSTTHIIQLCTDK